MKLHADPEAGHVVDDDDEFERGQCPWEQVIKHVALQVEDAAQFCH